MIVKVLVPSSPSQRLLTRAMSEPHTSATGPEYVKLLRFLHAIVTVSDMKKNKFTQHRSSENGSRINIGLGGGRWRGARRADRRRTMRENILLRRRNVIPTLEDRAPGMSPDQEDDFEDPIFGEASSCYLKKIQFPS